VLERGAWLIGLFVVACSMHDNEDDDWDDMHESHHHHHRPPASRAPAAPVEEARPGSLVAPPAQSDAGNADTATESDDGGPSDASNAEGGTRRSRLNAPQR